MNITIFANDVWLIITGASSAIHVPQAIRTPTRRITLQIIVTTLLLAACIILPNMEALKDGIIGNTLHSIDWQAIPNYFFPKPINDHPLDGLQIRDDRLFVQAGIEDTPDDSDYSRAEPCYFVDLPTNRKVISPPLSLPALPIGFPDRTYVILAAYRQSTQLHLRNWDTTTNTVQDITTITLAHPMLHGWFEGTSVSPGWLSLVLQRLTTHSE